MQIQRVQSNYNNRFTNFNRNQNISSTNNIGFQGGKQQLVAISADSFKSESAKKLYTKIQRYFKLIGDYGSIKDTKLFSETINDFMYKPPFMTKVEADVCLSINKGDKNSNIKLYHKYSNIKKNDDVIFEATLDKNGQMISGHFLPADNLVFERDKRNTRRMRSNFSGDTFLPVGGNDREWSCLGGKKPSSELLIEESEQGAYEIFLELARLKTAIK